MQEKIKTSILTFLGKTRFVFLIVTLMGIVVEIFYPGEPRDLVTFLLVILWFNVMVAWNLEADFSFVLGIFLLLAGQIFTIFVKPGPLGSSSPAEKSALWFYISFFLGLIRYFQEMKNGFEKSFKIVEIFKVISSSTERKKWSFEKERINYYAKSMIKDGMKGVNLNLIKIFEFAELFFLFLKISFQRIGTKLLIILKLVSRWIMEETKRFIKEYFERIISSLERRYNVLLGTKVFSKIKDLVKKIPIVQLIILMFFIQRVIKEIQFYRWFYKEKYFMFLAENLLIKLLLAWGIVVLLSVMVSSAKARQSLANLSQEAKKFKHKLLRKIVEMMIILLGLKSKKIEERYLLEKSYFFGAFFLLLLLWGEKYIFLKERDKFEFRPFINKITEELASKYTYILIRGHNFKEMPFKGIVTINGVEQKIVFWSDEFVRVETDPLLTTSGELQLINDYGFGEDVNSNSIDFTFFDSKNASAEEEKEFWETLKNVAKKNSEVNEEE